MHNPPDRDYFSRQLESMAAHRAILRAVECRLMGAVPLEPPVLDVGCGDGHFASIAYDRPLDVGVDVLASDLREARAREGTYHRVIMASAPTLPFPNASFATVVSNCVIEHIPDLDGTLSEIARVLRPGGTFATTLPSEHFPEWLLGSTLARRVGLDGLASAYGDFFNHISHHYHIHPPAWWDERLAAVGLRVVEHRYYFSAEAHRAFDLCHYLSVPNLVTRLLSGRWVIHPVQMAPFEYWLRRYYEEPLPAEGAYQFIRCERTT
jgi:SAM-dependent methyltransferase